MKSLYRKLIYIAFLLVASQTIAYLFSISRGTALLSGIAASVLYLVRNGDITRSEAVTGTAVFLASSFVFSSLGKIFFLDRLCEISKSSAEVESGIKIFNPEHICQSFLEAWVSALTTNPVYNWHYWAAILGLAALSIYLYSRYFE